MVFGVSCVRLLIKVPNPIPSIVKVFAMVGLASVLQQTPLDAIGVPPSSVAVPPEVAVV